MFGATRTIGWMHADEDTPAIFRMDFTARNRRPPRDAVNALLSLGYSMLAKDLTRDLLCRRLRSPDGVVGVQSTNGAALA